MPGQPMEMESMVAVLKFTSPVQSSSEEEDNGDLGEVCDDPTATLVIPSPSPSACEREEIDSGICDDAFDDGGNSGGGTTSEDELGDNWNPSLYTLQLEVPKAKAVHCTKELETRPPQYGPEYHGRMQREEAAELLGNESGQYLVRENPKGEHILSFVLDGRMYNYHLFYDEDGHFVGESKFEKLEDLVEDGLIILYFREHNVTLTMQRGRAIQRRKTLRQSRLKRQTARRIKGLKGKAAYRELRRSQSRSPPSSLSGEGTPPVNSSPIASPLPAHTTINLIAETPIDTQPHVLNPNSDDVESDLDVSPPKQRRASPEFTRCRSGCAIHASPLVEQRVRASSLEKLKGEKVRSISTVEALIQSTSPLAQRRVKSVNSLEKVHDHNNSALAALVQSTTSPLAQRRAKSAMNLKEQRRNGVSPDQDRYSSIFKVLKDAVKEDEAKKMNEEAEKRSDMLHKRNTTLPPGLPTGSHLHTHKLSPYYKAHSFKVHTYMSPAWCELCRHFLWGLKNQGWQCKDCGMNVHKQCVSAAMNNECNPTRKFVKRVFGVDLTTLVKLEGTEVPKVLQECIQEIESRDLSLEGLYRVSGQSSEILDLKEKYDEGETPDFSQYMDINIITSAVKLYLRDLPIPLISFDAYSSIMKATSDITHAEDPSVDWQPLANALKLLPKAHYNVLKYLAEHLSRVEQQDNKMTAYNLAVVFAPTLMRSPTEEVTLVKDLPMQKHFVEYVIREHDILFVH